MLTLDLVKFCAEEVARQQAQPEAVYWMVRAWLYAGQWRGEGCALSPEIVENIGRLVDPEKNRRGFRNCYVRVGGHVAPPPEEVPRLVAEWCASPLMDDPDEAYLAFQKIHPFRDGNGRTGKIVFNWLRGTLTDPAMPPNFFNCANP